MSKILITLFLTATAVGCVADASMDQTTEPQERVEESNAPLAQVGGANGWYYIQVRHSGKCLHQFGATMGNGDPINQWDCVDAPNVQWQLIQSPHVGYFYVKARHSGKCLHQFGATMGNGDPINQWDCVDAPNVQWQLIQSPHEGYYYFKARHSGKCLHQFGASYGNGDAINQWDCVDSPNVQWRLNPVPGSSPPPPNVPSSDSIVKGVTSEGTGCPAGTFTFRSAKTDRMYRILTSLWQQKTAVNESRSVDFKNCILKFSLDVPAGESVSARAVYVESGAWLDSDVELRSSLSYSVSGGLVLPTSNVMTRQGIVGPYTVRIDTSPVQWWPCGADRDLTVNLTERIRNSGTGQVGYTDDRAEIVIELNRQACQ